jgi:tetratricopeptide (TPR) repeat protein
MSNPRFEEARALYRQGNPREALETIEESLAAKDAAELSDMCRYYLTVLKSHCLSALGNWKEAARVLDSIEPDRIDQQGRVRLAMHKGNLMGCLAQYAACWTLLHTAEEGAQELGAEQLRGEVLWRRGMISVFAREHESAERNLSCALAIARAEKDRQLEALIKGDCEEFDLPARGREGNCPLSGSAGHLRRTQCRILSTSTGVGPAVRRSTFGFEMA